MSTNARGERAEAAVLAALVKAGRHVLLPWGSRRYDLVIATVDGSYASR